MKNKIILITGASSGIGFASAKRLLEEGHTVYGASRKTEKMKPLEEKGLKIIKLDITKEEDVKAAVEQVISEQGKIDVLFNNAGFGQYGAVEEMSIEKAKYQFEVNIFGLARITQLVIPHMRKQGSGTIINTSSMGGKMYTPLGAWYHATKHALEGWSDCLRFELKGFGIDVVIVEPGAIDTEFGSELIDNLPEGSKEGAYKDIVAGIEKAMVNESFKGSDPDVIAKVVSRAINAKTPKTRYVAGAMAKPLLFLRRWLSDRAYDWLLGRMMG